MSRDRQDRCLGGGLRRRRDQELRLRAERVQVFGSCSIDGSAPVLPGVASQGACETSLSMTTTGSRTVTVAVAGPALRV